MVTRNTAQRKPRPPRRQNRQNYAKENPNPGYKDVMFLRRFLNERGRAVPSKRLGRNAKFQRKLRIAIQRARFMALLPYAQEHRRVTALISEPSQESDPEQDRTEHSSNVVGDSSSQKIAIAPEGDIDGARMEE